MHNRISYERIARFYKSDHSNCHERNRWSFTMHKRVSNERINHIPNDRSISMHKHFSYERIVRFYNSDHSNRNETVDRLQCTNVSITNTSLGSITVTTTTVTNETVDQLQCTNASLTNASITSQTTNRFLCTNASLTNALWGSITVTTATITNETVD